MELKQMIEKGKLGDKNAEREIMEYFMPRVKIMAKSIFVKGCDDDDLFQIAMISILKCIGKITIKEDLNIEGYILKCVKNAFLYERAKAIKQGYNKSLDFLMSDDEGDNDEFVDILSSGYNIEDEFFRKVDIENLRKAINHLKEDEKEFVVKIFYNSWGAMKKYSEEKGISYSKCVKKKKAIIKKIKMYMEE